jgi:hypothetical protein
LERGRERVGDGVEEGWGILKYLRGTLKAWRRFGPFRFIMRRERAFSEAGQGAAGKF